MKIRTQNRTWTSVGIAMTLLSGSLTSLADDTELILLTPDPSLNPKPNVVFILDTSASMGLLQLTAKPYDSATTYLGDCATDKLYWTVVDVLPVCDVKQKQFIDKTAFVCDFAQRQIAGIGSFTNTMVQYRSEGDKEKEKQWQFLKADNRKDIVECQSDSGLHGDGAAGLVFALTGTGLSNPFTSDPTAEISWGSAPRNLAYTMYDGNYLNWKASPTTVTLSRSNIMKEVTKTVLKSVGNMNVGIMRFNFIDGGMVLQALTDLDTNRAALVSTVDSLDTSDWTPLSETMYENALYWMGQPAFYGEKINEHTTDPAALSSAVAAPKVYEQPALEVCAKNYNVLITDGEPTQDLEVTPLAPTLPGYTSLMGRSTCNGSGDGACLDDIAEYLGKADTSSNTGIQPVVTHTIGFTIDLPILADTAAASGGQYFLADDVESLTLALLRIITDINTLSLSFSAPAVAVNTFNRTQNLNDLYLTMFGSQAKAHWPGNLKKYKIVNRAITDADGVAAVDPDSGFFLSSARSFWTAGPADGNDVRLGGAANKLPDPSARNLYTNNGSSSSLKASSNAITTSNANAFTLADFGLTGSAGEPSKDDMIRWMRGEDIRDADANPTTTVRFDMGDPLHAQPAAIVYGGTAADPEVVVYTATNDGYLHAINGKTGVELWSFVPKELLPNMNRLFFDPNSQFKQYGLDGDVVSVVSDDNKNGVIDGSDFVRIIFGMRRGGSRYYAIDVTDKNSPELMWAVSPPELGQSWSTPVIARIDAPGVNAKKGVVIIGGGYDPVHDTAAHPTSSDGMGAAIYFLDLDTGNELWRAARNAGPNGLSLSTMTRAIPGQVRVIDISGDGLADRMYASDMGGQVWRFDIFNGVRNASKLVTGGVIAQLGAEGLASPSAADTRRFYTSPDVSLFSDPLLDRRFIAISLGSGYRAHPLDNAVSDRFYSIRDPNVFTQLTQANYDNFPIIDNSQLVEVSGQVGVVLNLGDAGWKFTLPGNEKVLSDSLTFDNRILFVGFSPDNAAAASCSTGNGTNVLYSMSVINGDPVVDNLDVLEPGDADDARRQALAQGGIAPSPTILFPSPDDPDNCTGAACAPPPIGCVGVECFEPGFDNNPVRTLWTQDGIE